MNTASASHADATPPRLILVWDAPVRVFHWLMVVCFAGAWLTSESERLGGLHVTLGCTMAGLVVFRIVWGLIGTRHARFVNFVRGPSAVANHVHALLIGRPQPHAGHNPAATLAILAMLGLAAAVTATGWATLSTVDGGWLKEVHEGAAGLMLAVVGVHIAGVLLGSFMERQNLAQSMVTGRKLGRPQDAIRSAWRSVAALMIVAVCGFWWLQWQDPPLIRGTGEGSTSGWGERHHHSGKRHHED